MQDQCTTASFSCLLSKSEHSPGQRAPDTRALGSPRCTPGRRIALDTPPPSGYDALLRANERVRRRRERLSDHAQIRV